MHAMHPMHAASSRTKRGDSDWQTGAACAQTFVAVSGLIVFMGTAAPVVHARSTDSRRTGRKRSAGTHGGPISKMAFAIPDLVLRNRCRVARRPRCVIRRANVSRARARLPWSSAPERCRNRPRPVPPRNGCARWRVALSTAAILQSDDQRGTCVHRLMR